MKHKRPVTPKRERGPSIKELEKIPILKSIADVKPTKIDMVTEIGHRPKAKKTKPQETIEKFLFDAVYSKKFMEVKNMNLSSS